MSRRESSLGSYKRKLRYRKLLENLEELDDAGINHAETIAKATNVIEEAEKLLRDGPLEERVDHPGEGLLDSRVLLASSNMMNKLADGFSGNVNVYDPDELAEHIKCSPQYWSSICIPKQIRNMMYLQGSFLPGPPAERPERQRRQTERQRRQPTQEPESLNETERVEEASEAVNKIKKFINRQYKANNNQQISYFEIVLNPNSFSKTIENIYHISFLVRDGLVSIQIDENTKLPSLAPVSKQDRERDNSNEQGENNQFIISLDMKDWQDAVKAFNITEARMD